MPLSKYDSAFGGRGGAKKAHAAMVAEYGSKEKADRVFYATKNKHMAASKRRKAAEDKLGKGARAAG